MVQRVPAGYVFDPADPREPSDEQWEAMTPVERERALAMLPSEPDVDFLPPSEGDDHWEAGAGARQTLKSFFRRDGKSIYISGNLAVYYPGERVFSPDVLAVLDVDPHPRQSWSVRREGRGLDFVLEIHVAGDRAKDLKTNVERYAQLGIQEYFVLDRGKLGLRGYRLPPPDPKRTRVYQPIVPQGGRFASEVLGLDLLIEGTALRFYCATAPLLDTEERLARVEAAFDGAIRRAIDAEERLQAEAEARRIAEERAEKLEAEMRARAEKLEAQVRELHEELERLKRRG